MDQFCLGFGVENIPALPLEKLPAIRSYLQIPIGHIRRLHSDIFDNYRQRHVSIVFRSPRSFFRQLCLKAEHTCSFCGLQYENKERVRFKSAVRVPFPSHYFQKRNTLVPSAACIAKIRNAFDSNQQSAFLFSPIMSESGTHLFLLRSASRKQGTRPILLEGTLRWHAKGYTGSLRKSSFMYNHMSTTVPCTITLSQRSRRRGRHGHAWEL